MVDGMMDCDAARLAYLVITDGGFGGVAERLFALSPHEISIGTNVVACHASAEAILARKPLEAD